MLCTLAFLGGCFGRLFGHGVYRRSGGPSGQALLPAASPLAGTFASYCKHPSFHGARGRRRFIRHVQRRPLPRIFLSSIKKGQLVVARYWFPASAIMMMV